MVQQFALDFLDSQAESLIHILYLQGFHYLLGCFGDVLLSRLVLLIPGLGDPASYV